jgi:hypothetical protein
VLVVFDLGLVVLNLRENVINVIKNVFYWGLGLGEEQWFIYLLCIDLFIEFLSDCMFKE